jgi:DNA polymerase III epsilon subunit family exonuclease
VNFITVVSFDVETTGLSPETEEILEIAAVKFTFNQEGGTIDLGAFTSLVKPTKKIPRFITEINNISDDMVKDAPELSVVLPKFFRFCGINSIMVAHNASFDAAFIGKAIRKCRMPMPLNPVFDSLKMIRKIMPEFRSHKLKEIAKSLTGQTALELDSSKLHRAEYDCIVLREVFCACLKKRMQHKDLAQDTAVKALTKIHGKPIAFIDLS